MNQRVSKTRSAKSHSKHGCRVISRRRAANGLRIVAMAALLLAAPQSVMAQNGPRTVTLITGDRIVVAGSGSVSIVPGKGREKMGFSTRRVALGPGQAPHLHVIPHDALPLIAAGKVDRRLFDVTRLIDNAYDDAHRDSLPLIITYAPSSARQLAATARSVPGAVIAQDLPSVNGVSATSAKARVHELWGSVVGRPAVGPSPRAAVSREPIGKIWLDSLLTPVLDRSVPQTGAPAAWALGYEGDGVVVAVLDTGVDETHADLLGRVVVSRNFTLDPDGDQVGHGTHVASIIAGSGAAEGGRYRGVAPGVQLLSGKVCEGMSCPESSIIAGIQWAVMEEGAQVVNLSLGGQDEPELDPLEEAVNTLSAEYGALFVIAAGNSGPLAQSIESPGSAEAALTVGAIDRDDQVAPFSSRGMSVGDHALKPDLTAPGVEIVAARAAGSELGTLVGEEYMLLSGTSMATPHVAGAAALLLQRHPEWGPAELKAALMGSAELNPSFTTLDQGAGRMDIAAALGTSLMADTPSLSFGLARWPHEDDELITRTVTYHNLGAATELVLELDVVGPEGSQAPVEMFTVTPTTLHLPEGGTGSVTVTANTRVASPAGVYSGRLMASDGVSRQVTLPMAVHLEPESYDLVLRHLDRDGAQTANYFGILVGVDQPIINFIMPPSEVQDLPIRLPKGVYALETMLYDIEGSERPTQLVAPNQLLAGDKLLEMDARAASLVSVSVPNPRAEAVAVEGIWTISVGIGTLVSGIYLPEPETPTYYTATIGPMAPGLTSLLTAQWLDAAATPPAFYAAAWTERGRLPVGSKSVDGRKMAVVHASYAASLPSSLAVNNLLVGAYPGGPMQPGEPLLPIELPGERTEYYYSDDKSMRWVNETWMHDEELTQSLFVGFVPRSYRAGQAYSSRWNEPPFSPVLPDESTIWDWASREGDVIQVLPPMYGDRSGHGGFISHEGRTALYRNGELIAEAENGSGGSFEVAPELASYRLELELSQSIFELSTREKTVWTFESAHVAEGQSARLPLLTARFDPELDERGRAPRGTRFRLPLSVARFGEKGRPHVSAPTVEVSYDDGASWDRVPVARDRQQWAALLEHPRRAEYVSLRASVRERDGSSVEQTLIRAYGLAGRP